MQDTFLRKETNARNAMQWSNGEMQSGFALSTVCQKPFAQNMIADLSRALEKRFLDLFYSHKVNKIVEFYFSSTFLQRLKSPGSEI